MTRIGPTASSGGNQVNEPSHEPQASGQTTDGEVPTSADVLETSGNRVHQPSYDRTVGYAGMTTSHVCGRFLQDHATQLTVTRPTAKEHAGLYAVLSTGVLTDAEHVLQAMLSETYDIYGREIMASGKVGRELSAVAKHCRSLKEPKALPSIFKVLGGVITDLATRGAIPVGLDICDVADLDADWRYMGAPNGVIDLSTGEVLPREIARWHRVTATVADDYDPDAKHPLVDLIMPPNPNTEEQRWWYRYRGWACTHPVHRDLLAMGTPPNTGKSALRNADSRSMGRYVVTIGRSAWAKPTGYAASSTAHNGQLTRMRSPARLAYSVELSPPLNTELLNEMTGGDDGAWARDVREKAVELRRPPHLVAQFNTRPGEPPALPIGGSTEAEVALRDRTFCLPMPVIPPEQRDGRLLDIARTDKMFRQAWVARTVQQCVAVWNSTDNQPTPPEGCTTMKDELARQARAARPKWETELIPRLFRPRKAGDPAEVSAGDSYTAYREYLDFHETDGDGPIVSQGAFTTALKAHYGPSDRRSKLARTADDDRKGRHVDAWTWPQLINTPPQELSSQASRMSSDLTETGTSCDHHPEESQVTCETCEDGKIGERSGADLLLSSLPLEKSAETRHILRSYWQEWCDHLASADHEHGSCPNCERPRSESDQGCPVCDPDESRYRQWAQELIAIGAERAGAKDLQVGAQNGDFVRRLHVQGMLRIAYAKMLERSGSAHTDAVSASDPKAEDSPQQLGLPVPGFSPQGGA